MFALSNRAVFCFNLANRFCDRKGSISGWFMGGEGESGWWVGGESFGVGFCGEKSRLLQTQADFFVGIERNS